MPEIGAQLASHAVQYVALFVAWAILLGAGARAVGLRLQHFLPAFAFLFVLTIPIFALGVSRVLGAALSRGTTSRVPELLFGLAVPVVVILYMLKFSKSYPDRVTHSETPVTQAPS